MKKVELVTGLALNTHLTAFELSDVLEVLGAIVQYAIQQKTEVHLPGIGEVSVNDAGKLSFTPDPALANIAKDPGTVVKIQNVVGLTNTDLYTAGRWVFKHNVNVCGGD